MKSLLKKYIKKTFNMTHNIYDVFGIKFKFKRKLDRNVSLYDLRSYSLASKINPNLEKYRGIYTNKSVVIIGGGGSIKYYEYLKDLIHVGINRAYKLENIDFKYLFAQDDFEGKEDKEGFINYKPDTCIKFLGLHTLNRIHRIRPETIARIKNKELYVLNNRRPQKTFYPIDITVEPFVFYAGTVFAVLQFLLLTNAKNIYLVGFDCDVSHSFKKDKTKHDLRSQFKYWCQFAEYKKLYWEDTNIISINPVNLKGLFKDVYTQSYVDAHSELQKENVEILKGV